ncbi:MAG: DNA repair protein RecN [Pseudomonadota bacterium]
MLAQLSIRDIVLIEQLDIVFNEGLSVLTGETGAGKSILLDSLALALGGRGDGSLVRSGAKEGSVNAVFEPEAGHPLFDVLSENGISAEDGLILRRVQKSDGKTRAFINDAPVSAGLLREIGSRLVEIHGQHDDRAMLDASTHRNLLDAHGGLEVIAKMTNEAWDAWQSAEQKLRTLQAEMEEAQREAEYLKSSSKELRLLAPEPNEEDELADRRQRMMKIEQVATDLAEANEDLSGNASPVTVISNLARRLERKRQQAPELVDETLSFLDTALDALYSAQNSLENAFRETEFDPHELERAEERLFALRAASRKYNVPVTSLPDLAVQMADDLAMLEEGEDRLLGLNAEVSRLKEEYFRLARELSGKRETASEVLSEAVMNELPALKLENARFMVQMETSDDNAGPNGLDSLEFWVQTNPGSNPGAMRKVASGGELSRFMLALKVALADRGSAPTLVFDEIDSGVGGAVADAIGKRLARLAGDVQVLSVTHAPQVAARATEHYLIAKHLVEGEEERVTTEIAQISDDNRLEEIARMLSGATVTDEARAAAEKLMDQPVMQ